MNKLIDEESGYEFEDLTGKVFADLEVIEYAGKNKNSERQWKCLCDCGKTTTVYGKDLKSGRAKSCGCYGKQLASKYRKRWMQNSKDKFNK